MKQAALAVIFVGGAAFAQDGGVPFLHGIGLESSLAPGARLEDARLVMKTPGGAHVWLQRRPGLARDAGTLTIELASSPEPKDAPLPRHKASSWLIDYSEKVFTPVWDELKPVKPTVEALTQFSTAYIARKSMRRGFDLASQVARSKEGDCTEHAVFLAAVLRHAKLPARVMLGLVVVVVEGRPQAFGHAWTEVWQGGKWTVADAAIAKEFAPVYLPTEEVVDEGPGFAVSLMPGIQALAFEGLKLEPR